MSRRRETKRSVLEELRLRELRKLAAGYGFKVRARITKGELLTFLIRKARAFTIEELKRKIEELRRPPAPPPEVKRLRTRVQELEGKLAASMPKADAEAKISRLEDELARSKTELAKAKAELGKSEAELKAAKAKIEELEAAVAASTTEEKPAEVPAGQELGEEKAIEEESSEAKTSPAHVSLTRILE